MRHRDYCCWPPLACNAAASTLDTAVGCVLGVAADWAVNGGPDWMLTTYGNKVKACLTSLASLPQRALSCIGNAVAGRVKMFIDGLQLPQTIAALGCNISVEHLSDAASCLVDVGVAMFSGVNQNTGAAITSCLAQVNIAPSTLTCLKNAVTNAVGSGIAAAQRLVDGLGIKPFGCAINLSDPTGTGVCIAKNALPEGIYDLYQNIATLTQCVKDNGMNGTVDYLRVTSVGELFKKFTNDAGKFVRNLLAAARVAVEDTVPQLLGELKDLGKDLLKAELTQLQDPIEYALGRAGEKVRDKADWLVDFAWNKGAGIARKFGSVGCIIDFVDGYRGQVKPIAVAALKGLAMEPKRIYVEKIRPAIISLARDTLDAMVNEVFGKDAVDRFKQIATQVLNVVKQMSDMTNKVMNVVSAVGSDLCRKLPTVIADAKNFLNGRAATKPTVLLDVLKQVAKDRLGVVIQDKGGRLVDSLFAAVASALHVATGVADSAGGLVPEVGAGAVALQSTLPQNLAWTALTYLGRDLVLKAATSVVGAGLDLVVEAAKKQWGQRADQIAATVSAKLGPFGPLAKGALDKVTLLLGLFTSGPGKDLDNQVAAVANALTTVLDGPNGLKALCNGDKLKVGAR